MYPQKYSGGDKSSGPLTHAPEHALFREETRWPGYYYRGDHMKLDDDNWHCLTVSRRDPKTGKFTMEKVPVYHIVDEKEKKKAS